MLAALSDRGSEFTSAACVDGCDRLAGVPSCVAASSKPETLAHALGLDPRLAGNRDQVLTIPITGTLRRSQSARSSHEP